MVSIAIVGESGIGETGIGEIGVGEIGIGETGIGEIVPPRFRLVSQREKKLLTAVAFDRYPTICGPALTAYGSLDPKNKNLNLNLNSL